jgi:hypothetical protein
LRYPYIYCSQCEWRSPIVGRLAALVVVVLIVLMIVAVSGIDISGPDMGRLSIFKFFRNNAVGSR